jgi:hypothetical protein
MHGQFAGDKSKSKLLKCAIDNPAICYEQLKDVAMTRMAL